MNDALDSESNANLETVIGLDVGGTKIVAGCIAHDGTILNTYSLPTPKTSADDIMQAALTVCRQAIDHALVPVKAIGAGSAGQVDSSTGQITYAANLVGWTGYPFGERLQREFNLPVLVDNDVNAMAYGESLRGAGVGASSVFYVAVGTGIGGAIVVNGQIWRGAHYSAGELSYLVANWDAEGNPQFLEKLTAGPALEQAYARNTGEALNLREISARAAAGEEQAIKIIEGGAAFLGRILNPVLLLLDPEMLIIGGGVPEIGALWWEPFEAAVRQGDLPSSKQMQVKRARFTFNAVMIGAGLLGWSLISPKG